MTTLRHATVVDGDDIRHDYRLEIGDGVFTDVRPDDSSPIGSNDQDLRQLLVIPGLIDLHNHGAIGHEYVRASADDAQRALDHHLAHGTTTLLASIGSADQPTMLSAVAAMGALARQPESIVAGIHLEGPYLSAERRGAHPPRQLRDASSDELAQAWDRSGGTVRVLTFAPERTGSEIAYRFCVDHGVVPAFGHSAADYATAAAWFARGVRHVTHATNAMNQIDRREPGPVPAALGTSQVTVELIADCVHVHPSVIAMIVKAAAPHQVVLVTDASSMTGIEDGRYHIGERDIVARDGGVYLGDSNTIAGSRITLIDALRNVVNRAGVSLSQAVRIASANPAAVIGMADRKGRIRPGFDADYLILSNSLELKQVVRAGAIAI